MGRPSDDPLSWFVFLLACLALIALDLALHAPNHVQRMSMPTSTRSAGFWFCVGLAFTLFVLGRSGWEASWGFLQGFLLEYMLSFDNLFVFHMIFSHYCTPEALVYTALYYGIGGAIVLRAFIIIVGYSLVNTGVYLVKILFGGLLIWSGYKSAVLDHEEETDISKNQCVNIMSKVLPISDHYEPRGHLFMDEERTDGSELFFERARQMDVRDRSNSLDGLLSTPSIDSESAVANLPRLESFEGSSLLRDASGPSREITDGRSRPDGMVPMVAARPERRQGRVKASLLLLVVLALLAVDLVFAIDSVASKLASVNDVFLNVTSSAFAMLGLRPLYFVMDQLVQSFHMLKYGISAVLVLIGLKLILSVWLEVPNSTTFCLIVAICIASAASSYWLPTVRQSCTAFNAEEDGLETVPEGEETTAFEQAEELEPMTPSRPIAMPVQFEEEVA